MENTAEKWGQGPVLIGQGFGTGMLFHTSGIALPEFKGF